MTAIVVIVFVLLAVGFAIAWYYLKNADKQAAQINYLRLPYVAISHNGHSIAASFAFRVDGADAEWASRHKQALEEIMKQELLQLEPAQVLAPNGIRDFQSHLSDTANGALKTTRIQEVLVTDFLVSEGDM